jgi:predicted glycosyltransferase
MLADRVVAAQDVDPGAQLLLGGPGMPAADHGLYDAKAAGRDRIVVRGR